MELRKIADKLGIGAYPEALETVAPVDICDETRIMALQEEFDLFGEYYEEVLAEAQRIRSFGPGARPSPAMPFRLPSQTSEAHRSPFRREVLASCRC